MSLVWISRHFYLKVSSVEAATVVTSVYVRNVLVSRFADGKYWTESAS